MRTLLLFLFLLIGVAVYDFFSETKTIYSEPTIYYDKSVSYAVTCVDSVEYFVIDGKIVSVKYNPISGHPKICNVN